MNIWFTLIYMQPEYADKNVAESNPDERMQFLNIPISASFFKIKQYAFLISWSRKPFFRKWK